MQYIVLISPPGLSLTDFSCSNPRLHLLTSVSDLLSINHTVKTLYCVKAFPLTHPADAHGDLLSQATTFCIG